MTQTPTHTNHRSFSFEDLSTADLVVDAIYRGGVRGNAGDDPLAKLLPCGNQGGFRTKRLQGRVAMAVLYTSLGHADWPDAIDLVVGDRELCFATPWTSSLHLPCFSTTFAPERFSRPR